MRFERMYSRTAERAKGLRYDQKVKVEGHYSIKSCPEKLGRIKYRDDETQKEFLFLTNNVDLDAEKALLYKKRWEVELFFKWMKQHLRIKSFWGTTINAVKLQVYCTNIAYGLVAIIGNKLRSPRSIYEILQIVSISLLDKTPVREIFTDYDCKYFIEPDSNHFKISRF